MSISTRSLQAIFTTLTALTVIACDDPLKYPSQVDSLRVLAVAADPPLPHPGQETKLTTLLVDADPANNQATPRPIEFLWINACPNPAGDLPSSCFDDLNAWLPKLSRNELLNPKSSKQIPQGAELKWGANATFTISQDIVTNHAPPIDDSTPYGVTMFFFAACAGQLYTINAGESVYGVPLACLGTDNTPVATEDFVVGYLPLRSFDSIENKAPAIEGYTLGGKKYVKTAKNAIAPVCNNSDQKDCTGLQFGPIVNRSSVEQDTSPAIAENEMLWVSYFADHGRFEDDSRLIYDPSGGFRSSADVASRFLPTPGYRGKARLWAVVRDQRMGVTWIEQQVDVK